MNTIKLLSCLGLVAAGGCTIDQYLPPPSGNASLSTSDVDKDAIEPRPSREALCTQLKSYIAQDYAGSEELTRVQDEAQVFYSSYCSQLSTWSICVGPTPWAVGAPPEGCWEEALPRIQCLLAPGTESLADCPTPMSEACQLRWPDDVVEPPNPLCPTDSHSVETENWNSIVEYTLCADGNTYRIECAKPQSGTCDLGCDCYMNGAWTRSLVLENLDHPDFQVETWQACSFPEWTKIGDDGGK